MKKLLALLAACLFISGCSTMTPARYSVSMDNNIALKAFAGSSVQVTTMMTSGKYDAGCRMMGPIQASDGMTIPQFVQKAFNDEFKFAGIYSDNGVSLNGNLTQVAFSSSAGLTGGWWLLALTLTSSNGKSLSVENKYTFESGFDGFTACNQTAQALGPAVQDLVKRVATDPQFGALLH